MPEPYTISTRIAGRIVRTAARAGASAAALCAEAGVEPSVLDDVDARISVDRYARLWESAVADTADRALPVRVATDPNTMTNVLQFVAMTSATLREGLDSSARYLAVLTNGASWFVRDIEDGVAVRVVHPAPKGTSIHADEFALAEIVARGRAFSGVRWSPREVRFAHAGPSDISAYNAFFGAPIRFAAHATELVLDEAVARLPLTKADPGLREFFERHLGSLIQAAPDAHASIAARVRHLLAREMVGEAPSLDAVGSALGIGARTLRRRLADEGIGFRSLVDERRSELAKAYLEGDTSIAEIAFLLGFANAPAFHRAFRRWHGMTPREHRAALEVVQVDASRK